MLTQRKCGHLLEKITDFKNAIWRKGCFLLVVAYDPLANFSNQNYDISFMLRLRELSEKPIYRKNLCDNSDFNYDMLSELRHGIGPKTGIVVRLRKYNGRTHFVRVYNDFLYDPARGLLYDTSIKQYIIEYSEAVFNKYQIRDTIGFNNHKFIEKEFKTMKSSKFDKWYEDALIDVLSIEGGYVNHPSDPGKETYLGISRKYNPDFSGWRIIDGLKKHGVPIINGENKAKLMSLAIKEVFPRYRNFESFLPAKCEIKTYRSLLAFSINAGNSNAIRAAQQCNTFSAVRDYIINYYRDLLDKKPQLEVFRKGWSHRLSVFFEEKVAL